MLKYESWAVVGASKDIDSASYKIMHSLKEKHYTVYGINPKYDNIDGIKVYETLKDVPHDIDVVSMIVNPSEALSILDEVELLDIKNVWFQRGSFNDEVIQKAKELNLHIEYKQCLYAELNKKQG